MRIWQSAGALSVIFFSMGCSSMNFDKTVDHVEIAKFMGPWYVWAGRTTFMEKGAYNAVEKYSWNTTEKRIDIDFSFNKDSFTGPLKKIPQKAWIYDPATNAHWKVQPFWPLKFDYLVIALEPNYQWTAIGVPSGSYLWIMGRSPIVSDSALNEIIMKIQELGYPIEDVVRVPQQTPPASP